jgi:hypothetical protein
MSFFALTPTITSADAEVQQLRTRIMAHIQARIASGERYSETKLAREAGIAQQTLNDFLRAKTTSVTRLTRIKLIDFLENRPSSHAAPPPYMTAGARPPVMLIQMGGAPPMPMGAPPMPNQQSPFPPGQPPPAGSQPNQPLPFHHFSSPADFAQLFVASSPAYLPMYQQQAPPRPGNSL